MRAAVNALGAAVWLLARVDTKVVGQISFLVRRIRTDGTTVHLNAWRVAGMCGNTA